MMLQTQLEADFLQYEEIMREAHDARRSGDFQRGVELAISATCHVNGMMQYERRFAGQTDRESVGAIDFVLNYAPLIFDLSSIEHVAGLLKSQRSIDKNTSTDIAAKVERSRELLWDAYRVWNLLETESDTRQETLRVNLGGEQDRWRWLADIWQRMGYITRTPEDGSYRLSLSTRLDEKVRGKCPSCGVVGNATKMRLLDDINCPKCQAKVNFIFLANVEA